MYVALMSDPVFGAHISLSCSAFNFFCIRSIFFFTFYLSPRKESLVTLATINKISDFFMLGCCWVPQWLRERSWAKVPIGKSIFFCFSTKKSSSSKKGSWIVEFWIVFRYLSLPPIDDGMLTDWANSLSGASRGKPRNAWSLLPNMNFLSTSPYRNRC